MTRQYHKQWTPEQTAAVVKGFNERMTDQEVKDRFNLPFSVHAIRCKRARMNLVSSRRSEAVKEWHDEKRRRRAAMCLQAVSIWHLVDLKRAGHSPTRTEMHLFKAARSPAALMAEG